MNRFAPPGGPSRLLTVHSLREDEPCYPAVFLNGVDQETRGDLPYGAGVAPPRLKCYSRIKSVTGNPLSVKRMPRHRLLRAVLALCLLGQLGTVVLGFAQPCAMPAADDHATVMTMGAHDEAMAIADAMDAMDCCQDDGPCLMAHCMAPPGACGAEFTPAPPAAVVAGPAAPPLFPRALPRRHFRPPITA